MAFVRLELTGRFGGGARMSHEYLLVTTGEEDAAVVNWLNNQAATATEFIQRPNGSLVTGAALPIVDTYNGRELESSPDYEQVNLQDNTRWKITAHYSYPGGGNGSGSNGSAGATFAFEYGPDVDHLKYSLDTVGQFPPTGVAVIDTPDTFRAINLRTDGTVEGVRLPNGQQQSFGFTNTSAWFTAAKRLAIARARGSVNSGPLTMAGITYLPGEVRFLGASGTVSSNSDSTIELRFSTIANALDVRFPGIDHASGIDAGGGSLTQINVDGWDYMWVYYGKGTKGNVSVNKPKLLLVERILPRVNLNALFT